MSTAYGRECNSLYRGVIEDNKDPKNLGRCRVRVPSIHGELKYPVSLLPWARPLVLAPVKSGKGVVNIPDVGDIVWVMFEGSNRDFPIYFGGTYAVDELDINTDIVDFYIEKDSKISYDRLNKVYHIKIGDTYLSVSPSGVSIVGNTTIQGDLSVSGTITVSDLIILRSCNKECDCT